MLIRIAHGEYSDQTASSEADLGLHYLSRQFWQVTIVLNFRTPAVFLVC